MTRVMGVLALLGVLGVRGTEATAGEHCEARLTVELTPDPPNASDEPEYRCDRSIETVRKDARVLSIRVDSTQVLNPAVAQEPLSASAAEPSGTQSWETGLGALYWAVQHPRQAWRVLLPLQDERGR